MVTGSRALVDCLVREGIDHVFGIPGTQNLPIIDALRDTPRIRFILTRHEQGAAFMAYGFARARNAPAVVTATEGPGITNLATGVAAAFRGYVPLIGVNGTQEDFFRERDALQEMEQIPFFRPITKWAYTVPSAGKMQEAMRKAFRVALTEPQGPVHVEASREILLEETESEPIEPAAYRCSTLPSCNPVSIDQAMALLAKAQRPVFLAGGGLLTEEATPQMVELANASGIPVATFQPSPDTFPSKHPLALGPIGRNGWTSANTIVPRADLVIAIGARMDVFSTTFKYGVLPRDAALIHQSVTPHPIGVVYPVTLGVVGSTSSFVEGLTERIRRAGHSWDWVDVGKARAEWDAERQAEIQPDAEPIAPPLIAHLLRKVIPESGIFILDAGNASKNLRVHFESYSPLSFMYTDDWGAVGSGLPIALGAKLARPDRPVACICGDMGFMANVGELETAMREKIPAIIIVQNDNGLGNERAWQKELYGGRIYGVDYQNPDLSALARVFGAFGERISRPADFEGALRRAIDSNRPAVIEVMVDPDWHAPVTYKGA